jgi:hypothetical protein
MQRLLYIVASIVAAPIVAAMMLAEFYSRILYRLALFNPVASDAPRH